jgi:hypothetical protein
MNPIRRQRRGSAIARVGSGGSREGLVRQTPIAFSSPLPLAREVRGGEMPRHRLVARAPSPTLPRKREREQNPFDHADEP